MRNSMRTANLAILSLVTFESSPTGRVTIKLVIPFEGIEVWKSLLFKNGLTLVHVKPRPLVALVVCSRLVKQKHKSKLVFKITEGVLFLIKLKQNIIEKYSTI
jgi:hypothetical protein